MRESVGKSAARKFFYEQCLPSWLTTDQLRSGNFLLLLGEEPRELPYFDALGIARERIWSVERDPAVYLKQLQQDLRVSLYRGDMTNYLQSMLHGNQGFLVLNLDIEGGYLRQLDPAMTSVLLFCWRNPETVVATYSTIGRDTELLFEGIHSYAVAVSLAPGPARSCLASLTERYRHFGFTEPLRMALRDFFWMRSMLEHALVASASVGCVPVEAVEAFFVQERAVWDVVRRLKTAPLRVESIEASAEFFRAEFFTGEASVHLRLPIAIGDVSNLVYSAERPWSQRCYFAKTELLKRSRSLRRWFTKLCTLFMERPFLYIDRNGALHDASGVTSLQKVDQQSVLWDDFRVYGYTPREIPVRLPTNLVTSLRETIRSLVLRSTNGRSAVKTRRQKRPRSGRTQEGQMARNGSRHYMTGGKLTDFGKEKIRELAAKGLGTQQIKARVPNSVPERVVRAHVAVSRRSQ